MGTGSMEPPQRTTARHRCRAVVRVLSDQVRSMQWSDSHGHQHIPEPIFQIRILEMQPGGKPQDQSLIVTNFAFASKVIFQYRRMSVPMRQEKRDSLWKSPDTIRIGS